MKLNTFIAVAAASAAAIPDTERNPTGTLGWCGTRNAERRANDPAWSGAPWRWRCGPGHRSGDVANLARFADGSK